MLRTGSHQLLRASALPRTAPLLPLAATATGVGCASFRGAHSRAKELHHRRHPLEEEYTKEAHYPPIEELNFKANLLRKRNTWYEHIRELPTVEEKLMALNMPRYYGYKCLSLSDSRFPYDCLPFVQHSTRTLISDGDGLPAAVYEPLQARAKQFVETIREDIQAAVVFETIGYDPSPLHADPDATATDLSRASSSRLIAQIHRTIRNALAADCAHLHDCESDVDPRHEAFWFVGGIAPPTLVQKIRKGSAWQTEFADEPVNRQLQYVGQPLLTVRSALPLRPHAENAAFSAADVAAVPQFSHDPRTIGYSHEYRHGATVPGFWPGATHEFGQLAYLSRHQLVSRNPAYGAEDNECALRAQAILASFGWLLGQACYQGFSIFNDPTYALATQTVITDGQHWSFYAYQLNTTQTHQDALATNQKVNQCWATREQKLYESVDAATGQIVGWNDAVLQQLVQMYLNEPVKRTHAMRPFLGADEQRAAQIVDAKRREFVESRYKHLVSNRPRHRLVPEVYNWEKIYKIDNNTLPLTPKRRPFELRVNPFERRLDDHTPVYVPKAIRPGGPKSKVDRWEPKFYPQMKK